MESLSDPKDEVKPYPSNYEPPYLIKSLVLRMRQGKPGGGKGALMSEEKSLTFCGSNDQTLFIFYGNRVDDLRLQGEVINTLQARMGTGGNNMPMVASVKAYDELNNSLSEVHHTLRAGTKQSTGVLTTSVRRLTPIECERLQGFPDNWTEGQPMTHRYKQMGNAVTVPVAQWIFQRLDTLDYGAHNAPLD